MTQDEIMEMWNSITKYAPSEVRIAEFAHLVAAKEREACVDAAMKAAEKAIDVAIELEREACAKVAEHSFGAIGSTIALAIKARGEV